MKNPFEFADAPSQEAWADSFVISVPTGLQSKRELLEALAKAGRFPSYFGGNWDALLDCLRDFEGVHEKQIVIVHGDVPLNAIPADCRIYLEVLRDAVDDWASAAARSKDAVGAPAFPDHVLKVLFPSAARGTVSDLLGDR